MASPHPPADDDLEALRRRIGDPRRWTFVLDFDGTLAPIVDRPEDARPAPGALEAVADLAAVCEVALLSGRALDDLEARLGEVPRGLLLVGGHGSEGRRPDGTRFALTDLRAAAGVLDEIERAVHEIVDGTSDGWLVERKSTSVALHHRLVDEATVDAVLPRARAVLDRATDRPPGFVVLAGKSVVELKVATVDKGVALSWIVEQAADRAALLPGEPPIAPLVVGDDVTDEDAFAAAVAVGGEAVLVAEQPTATSARFRLRDPARVVTLLRAVREPLGTEATAGIRHDAWDG